MIIIGIDPGLSGAVAFIETASDVVVIQDTPVETVSRRRVYLVASMGDLLEAHMQDSQFGTRRTDCHAFIEYQQTFPGMPPRSMFSIGYGYGLWVGLLAGMNIPYTIVKPPVWKRGVDLPKGSDKKASVARAQQLYPRESGRLPRGKDGRAEALLIAEYGRRSLT